MSDNSDTSENEDDFTKYVDERVEEDLSRAEALKEKYGNEVKKNLLEARKYEGEKKEKYKSQALTALKKQKFYEKRLEALRKRKFKKDIKVMDRDLKKQKAELNKITKDFKKKIALLMLPNNEEPSENQEEEDDEDLKKIDIDVDLEVLNENYLALIKLPEVVKASENLNIFKFIFQD